MALTLRTAITADRGDTVFDVLGTDPLAHGDIRSIGSEYVYIRTASLGTPGYGGAAYWRVGVERAVFGTALAAHVAAATVGAVDLTASPGGGSLSVTDGTTTVAEATSLQVPSVSDEGGGVAGVGFVISDVGAPTAGGGVPAAVGSIYVNTADGTLWSKALEADDGWVRIIVGAVGDPDGLVSSISSVGQAVLVNADGGTGFAVVVVAPGKGVYLQDGVTFILNLFGTVDPSAGGGVGAPAGSLYQRQNGSVGELWVKTDGDVDTGWDKVTTT